MIRLRYPNGIAVEYLTAKQLTYAEHAWLLTNEVGKTVVVIQHQAGVVVEFVGTWNLQLQPAPDGDLEKMLDQLIKHARELTNWSHMEKLKELKHVLDGFDARSKTWKPEG
jgi:hypothetical protein